MLAPLISHYLKFIYRTVVLFGRIDPVKSYLYISGGKVYTKSFPVVYDILDFSGGVSRFLSAKYWSFCIKSVSITSRYEHFYSKIS